MEDHLVQIRAATAKVTTMDQLLKLQEALEDKASFSQVQEAINSVIANVRASLELKASIEQVEQMCQAVPVAGGASNTAPDKALLEQVMLLEARIDAVDAKASVHQIEDVWAVIESLEAGGASDAVPDKA